MSNLSRREFLERSMMAATAAFAATGPFALSEAEAQEKSEQEKQERQNRSPNERLGVATIGAGGRGGSHISFFGGRQDTQLLYVCDVDSAHNTARNGAKFIQDLREAMDDKSVDCVSIATPNHWHSLAAIWAMQAGKDVYCEKPLSHNISEGRRVVEVARKTNRICQVGTQCRSIKANIDAVAYVKEGKIGKVNVSRGLCYKPRASIGPKGAYPIPAGMGQKGYDLWLGPAPFVAMSPRQKFHYDWHWFWDYGNGDIGNQGIHEMDKARWLLGVDKLSDKIFSYGGRLGYEDAGETANTQVVVHDYGDKAIVFEVRGLSTQGYKGSSVGNVVEGTEGYVMLSSYTSGLAFDKAGNQVARFTGQDNNAHFANFVSAVRAGSPKTLNAECLEGHLSAMLVHAGNTSYRLGKQVAAGEVLDYLKTLKMSENLQDTYDRFAQHLTANRVDLAKAKITLGETLIPDVKNETYVNNDKANAMLTRDYRAPYVVPAKA